MEREIIKVIEFEIGPLCDDDYWENITNEIYDEYFDEFNTPIKHHFSDDFKFITEEVTYYDLEKRYEEIKTIIKRLSDDKYFRIDWVKTYYRNNEYPDTIEEVFPKQKTITVYE